MAGSDADREKKQRRRDFHLSIFGESRQKAARLGGRIHSRRYVTSGYQAEGKIQSKERAGSNHAFRMGSKEK